MKRAAAGKKARDSGNKTVWLVASGDLRLSANQVCWPEQKKMEAAPQWPIMHAVFDGISRDQMMARHQSNHIQVVYAPNARAAHRAARIKAAALAELGLRVHFCGDVRLS